AVAPDLLSSAAPNNGRTKDFSVDGAVEAIGKLPPSQITADLNAAANYGLKLPAANSKLFVAGFCWGGSQTFRFATNRADLSAAFVFYNSSPLKDSITSIKTPIYDFYASNDSRIGATLPETTENMKAAGRKYEPVTYENAGHSF